MDNKTSYNKYARVETLKTPLSVKSPERDQYVVLPKDMEHYASNDGKDSPSERKDSLELFQNGMRNVRGESKKVSLTPPAFTATPYMRHSFFFRTVSSLITSESVTVGDLIACAGMIGTISNSTCTTIFSAVKLKSITIWSSTSDSNVTNAEVAFQAVGGLGYIPDKDRVKAVQSGVTTGGGCKWTVPKDSIASNWMSSSLFASEVFTLYDIPVGSIIRVDGQWCMRNALAGVTRTGFTSVTVGGMYYDYLDGNTLHKCLPIGVPGTF